MDRETLELHVDMAIQSLYGKVGSARLQYLLQDYSRKTSTFTLLTKRDSAKEVWGALVMSAATLDGLTAVRF